MSIATLYRSSDGLRDVHGRGMNIHSNVYKLPADAEEHDRLTLQHRIWKLAFGGTTGLFPQEVEDTINRLLSPSRNKSNIPMVLDLGSGSGIWAAEMAATYPHAKVVGLDLAEPKLQKNLVPPNCSFVTLDLTKGLDAYRESFDVVHCRCVAGHLEDRIQLMRELAKVLRPGGLLLLGDGNLHLYHRDGSYVLPASSSNKGEGSWAALWSEKVISRMLSKTLDPEHAGGEYVGWLIQQEKDLAYMGERAYFSPLRLSAPGKEERDEKDEEIASLMRRNISDFLEASRSVLLEAETPRETVDEWVSRARAEIMQPDPEAEETWSGRWDIAWAMKRTASEKPSFVKRLFKSRR